MQIYDRGTILDAIPAPVSRKCSVASGLLKLNDGTLLCVFNTGPTKFSPTDQIVLMSSQDVGETWAIRYDNFSTQFNQTMGAFHDAKIIELSPGHLLLSLFWVDRSDSSLPMSHPETAGILPTRYLVTESFDVGHTWSSIREVDLTPCRGHSLTDRIIRLKNRQLMMPYETWRLWDEEKFHQAAKVRLSHDEGKTWSDPIVMASDPLQEIYFWDNRVAIDPQTGRLVAMYWTYNTKQGIDQTISINWANSDATNWTKVQSSPLEGQIAAPLAMGEQLLLCVYVRRSVPASLRAVISHDFGRSWEQKQELVLFKASDKKQSGMDATRSEAEYWQDMQQWSFGLPSVIQLNCQTAMVSFYAGDENAMGIHWIKILMD